MPDYEILYRLMFDAVTDAVNLLQKGDASNALSLMLCAQECIEEEYAVPK